MKYRLVMSFCLFGLFFANPAVAQSLPGSVGVFSDPAGTDCNILDNGSLVQVHVVHVNFVGATSVQFKLDVENTGWTYISETWPFYVIGRSIDGAATGYGTCASGTYNLCVVNFFGSNAPPCTYIGIVPDPSAPQGRILAADCSNPQQLIFPTGGQGIVNPTAGCMCSVPIEETTWGNVKALYR